jgi:predicted Fe-Mo cluster-binding NifX family protein
MTLCLAVPTDTPGGLEAHVSPHFGHCDAFTLLDFSDGTVIGARVLAVPTHQQGGCMVPVRLLADNGATAVVVEGIGRRPLLGFVEVGVKVYSSDGLDMVRDVAAAWVAGSLPEFLADEVCGGGNHEH